MSNKCQYKVDQMIIWGMIKLAKCQIYKLLIIKKSVVWEIVKLIKWLTDKLVNCQIPSWQNSLLANNQINETESWCFCQGNKISSWWNGKLMEQKVYEKVNWWK